MVWTDPIDTDWETNDVVTETQIKVQVLDDLRHLRGQDGVTELEGDQNPLTDNARDLGSGVKRWRNLFAMRALLGGRVIRENWSDASVAAFTGATAKWQAATAGAGMANNDGGHNQHALKVDADAAGNIELNPAIEVTPGGWAIGAFNNAVLTAQNPAFSFNCHISNLSAELRMFIGLRATRASASIPAVTEIQAGLYYDGATSQCRVSDGVANTDGATFVLPLRFNLMIIIKSGSRVEFFVNGVSRGNLTTNLPTGDLEISFTLISVGGGAVGADRVLTLRPFEGAEEP